MSKTRLAFALRREVAAHFGFCCAYCQSREAVVGMHFTVDHIVPEVFGGSSAPQNLCLACWDCNLAKGGRVAAADPLTNQLAPLYHPRKQVWQEHFGWEDEGLYIVGRTVSGRATVDALTLNREVLVQARRFWTEVGWHPPGM